MNDLTKIEQNEEKKRRRKVIDLCGNYAFVIH